MSEKTSKNAIIINSGRINENMNFRSLTLQIKGGMEILPGQFVALEPLNGGRWVVPFSITDYFAANKDTVISIDYKVVGDKSSSTNFYANLNDGDEINVIGPCGKGFKLAPEIKHCIFVAGGTGAAGLRRLLIDSLSGDRSAEFLLGVKNKTEVTRLRASDSQGKTITPKIIIETSRGGLVTELLVKALEEKRPNTAIIACGPRKMLKAVYDLALKENLPCFVSVEELIACGSNSCKGCAIEMTDGTILNVCKDGPVFDAYKINWKKFLPATPITFFNSYLKDSFTTILHGQDGRTLELPYPWMVASGCLGIDEAEKTPLEKIGAYVTKGVTLHPQSGNPSPRICETSHGMINSIGVQNVGIDKFIKEELPRWLNLGKNVIVNIAGKSIEDYPKIIKKLRPFPIAAYEINISCPNVDKGGMAFGTDSKDTFKIVRDARLANPDAFIIVKLTPNVTDIVAIALAACNGGADALTISNTILGMDIDVKNLQPKIGRVVGGYSGPAILPIILAKAYQVYQAKANINIPIIGCGGIINGEDVLKYFFVGSSAVMVGTGWIPNKNIFNEITNNVYKHLNLYDTDHIKNLIGKMPVL